MEKTVDNLATMSIASAEEEIKKTTSSDYYFDSYSHFGIHEEMLKDSVRTNTYRKSIIENKHLFKGKVVLDVGCGTGILSMFAAQAGASKVIGIDCAGIAVQARKIVEDNGFSDVITIIQAKLEDAVLPVQEVDIIISEWMGYFLLYESMLDSVLWARDKYLKPDGLMFPDQANMYICAIEDSDYKNEKISFWDNVYGFDMSSIKEMAMVEPLVDTVPASGISSSICKLFSIDLMTVTLEELDFHSSFSMEVTNSDFIHGLVVYFDVTFSPTRNSIGFSTGPMDKYTHWKQTVFYLDSDLNAKRGDKITGTIDVARNKKNPRDLDIVLRTDFSGANQELSQKRLYRLR